MNLVVGATGVVGGGVAKALAGRGEPVRAMVRPESPGRTRGPHTPVTELEDSGVEIVSGDLTDRASLSPALEGIRRVVCTASTAKRDPDLERTDVGGIRDLVDAAGEAGVEQFVFVSAAGASVDHPDPVIRGKGLVEEHLRASDVRWTILQPVLFMEDWVGALLGLQLEAAGRITILGGLERRFSYIAAADVSRVTAATVGRQEALGRSIPLSVGPASYREILDAVEAAMGTRPPVSVELPGTSVPGLPPVLSEMWGGLAQGPDMEIATPEVAREFGVELTPLTDWVRAAFAGTE